MADLTGRVVNRRYRVKRLIGEGAMSSVYLAEDVQSPNSECALKVLKHHLTHDPKFNRRFKDEAESLAKLTHPNILKMYAFFRDGDDYCIALSYVDGMALAALIDRDKAIPEAQALSILKPILSALDHGHQNGVIHRDVKPSNILIDKSGLPLLCDFGIAKQVAERGVTVTGMTLGTPEYMSPEQIQAPQTLDHRTDVYSAGIVLFEMLTGRVPFVGDATDSDFAIRKHQVESIPPDPRTINPNISPGLACIVLKALRKDPSKRYQGCLDFLSAIEKFEQAPYLDPINGDEPSPTNGDDPPSSAAQVEIRSRQYCVYEHPTLGWTAVKKGFCWPAFFAGIFWMLVKKLYRRTGIWAAMYFGLFVFLSVLHNVYAPDELVGFLAVSVLLVLGLIAGLNGNAWRESELVRRGFVAKGTVPARTADGAVALVAREG